MTRATTPSCARGSDAASSRRRSLEVAAFHVHAHQVAIAYAISMRSPMSRAKALARTSLDRRLVEASLLSAQQRHVVYADGHPLLVARAVLEDVERVPERRLGGPGPARIAFEEPEVGQRHRDVVRVGVRLGFSDREALDEHLAGAVEVAAEVVDAAERVEGERHADPVPDAPSIARLSDANASAALRSPAP